MGQITQLLKKLKRTKKLSTVKQTIQLVPYQPETETEKFDRHYEKTDSCWNWLGSLDRYGYGKFRIGNRTFKAHRYSYQHYYGDFDESFHVLHHCDNPRCVNPHHLFLGTNRDNVADRTAKKRHGETSKRLTANEKAAIIATVQQGRSLQSIAQQFQVHISTIRRVLKRTVKPI
jgi:hypothetical protein